MATNETTTPQAKPNKRLLSPTIKVTIDEVAILRGVEKSSTHCVIAEAIKAQHPQLSSIAVDMQFMHCTNRENRLRYTYVMPREGSFMLAEFDEGIKPHPMTLTFRNPYKVTGIRAPAPTPSSQDPDAKRQRAKLLRRTRRAQPPVTLTRDEAHQTLTSYTLGAPIGPMFAVEPERDGARAQFVGGHPARNGALSSAIEERPHTKRGRNYVQRRGQRIFGLRALQRGVWAEDANQTAQNPTDPSIAE